MVQIALSIFRKLFLPNRIIDVIDKPLTEEQKQKEIIRINQEIINCDDWIMKLINDPHLQFVWIEKKERLELTLQDLETDEFI
jgi:hypothetical protein